MTQLYLDEGLVRLRRQLRIGALGGGQVRIVDEGLAPDRNGIITLPSGLPCDMLSNSARYGGGTLSLRDSPSFSTKAFQKTSRRTLSGMASTTFEMMVPP